MSSTVEGATQVRDTTGLATALEAVLFTLNRAVTVLELRTSCSRPCPTSKPPPPTSRKRWRDAASFCNAIRTSSNW